MKFLHVLLIISLLPIQNLYAQKAASDCLNLEESIYLMNLTGNSLNADERSELLNECDGGSAKILAKEAGFFFDEGNYSAAKTKYLAAIAAKDVTEDELAMLHFKLGLTYFEMGMYSDAVMEQNRAEEHGKYKGNTHFQKGRAYYAKGDIVRAKAEYLRALEVNKDDHSALNNLALCYENENNLAAATSAYKRANELAGGADPLYLGNTIGALRMAGRLEEAATLGAKAVVMFPDHVGIMDKYAWTLSELGRHDEALALAKPYLKNNPRNTSVTFRIAYSYSNMGNLDSSLYYYHLTLNIAPWDYAAADNLADNYFSLGQFDRALHFIDAALKAKPLYHKSLRRKHTILLWMFRLQDAHDHYLTYMDAYPNDPDNDAYVGYSLLCLGRYEEAIPYLERDRQYEPTDSKPYNNLGRCYAKLNEPERALAYFDTALLYDATNSFVYHNRASLYYDLGEYDKACEDMKQAIELEYNWTIDSSLYELPKGTCPDLNLNRKMHYHGYKGNAENLISKKFIELLPMDSIDLPLPVDSVVVREVTVSDRKVHAGEVNSTPFRIYPNPSPGRFQVQNVDGTSGTVMKVFNMQSQLVAEYEIAPGTTEIGLEEAENGTYIILISNSSSVLHTSKLVISR